MHNSIFMGSQEQAASFFALSGVYAIGLGSLSGPLTKRCQTVPPSFNPTSEFAKWCLLSSQLMNLPIFEASVCKTPFSTQICVWDFTRQSKKNNPKLPHAGLLAVCRGPWCGRECRSTDWGLHEGKISGRRRVLSREGSRTGPERRKISMLQCLNINKLVTQ